MEEQYNFDINLDFFDSSATAPALTPQNATTTTAGDYKQGQPMYDIESLANRIASVDDVVVQLKTLKEDHVKLQKQMQDLSDSAMSIRCMYEREKTERAKYALLSKELQEKCDHAESQLTNKTLHFEQLTSKIEQSSVKGPIVYNELALKYQRLALQLEDDKQLNHKERASLQQIQEYIEAQKLTPLSAFKKKVQVAQPKKQFHDYAMQCDLRYETRTQGTSMEDTRLLKKEMCSQGTQYTWYTTTRGTNTPSINSPLKEVRTQGTQYISSTTTRGTCTSPLVKKQSIGIGTDFPEVMPFSIAHIFSEMLVQVPPISPIPDVPVAVRELETEKKKKVEMKSVSTNTGLQNVRKPIDYVQPSIKRSDSRPPSRNVYDRVKNELPFMAMPTMNPFSGLGMGPSPLHQTVAELWNMLGHTIFALVQNGSAPATPMQRNLSAHDIARRRERQRSRDEQSNPGKDYFEGEASDYLPNIRSTATSPISPQGYGVPDGTNFFGESYMQHPAAPPSAFVPVARSENKASSPIEIQKIMLNRGDQAEGMGISLKKTSRVDEILKLFPEHSQSSQKRKAIRSLLKTSKKEKKWSRNGIQTLELEPQTNLNDEQFVTSSGGLIYSNDSAMAGYGIAGSSKGESFSRPAQLSEEGFLGFQDEGCSVQSDEVFCKPFVPPKRRQTDVVTNPFDIRENERLQMGGGETTAIAHSSPGHERNENQRTNEMIGNCSPFLQNEGMESHRLQRAGGTNRGLEMPSIFNHFNEKDRKEDQQSQNGKEANNRLDVIHNTSLGKNINRKRRTSTPDARQYNKVYKIGESNNALVPVIHSNSAQRSLNLTKSAAQQDKKPPMNKRISPTLDRLQNSPFCDQKTLNLNKSNESSAPRKFKPSNSVLRQQKMLNLNRTATSGGKKSQKKSATGIKKQSNSFCPSQRSVSEIPLRKKDETDFDLNERQEKPRIQNLSESPTPNRCETDWDYNEVLETNSYDPSATRHENLSNPSIFSEIPGPNKVMSPYSVLQAQMASNFNKEQKKPLDAQVNSERPSLNEDDSKSVFRQKGLPDLGPSCSKFPSPTPSETDWDFDERQEKPMKLNLSENPSPNRYETDFDYNEVLETNSYDPSATRHVKLSNPSIFNEIPGPNKELSPYFVLQAQNASNFNKEQKKPLDTQENSEHPSLKEDDSESIFRQEGLPNLGPSCIKFQYSTLNETDWGFDESQEKTPDISDDLIASELESPPKFNEFSALKEEKPLNSVFHTQKTSPGREEDCSAYPSNEQKTSNCYEFLETKQAKSINCGFEEQEMGSKVGNNVMFEAHDQRMSNSTPKQENQMYYLCQDQKTALENGDSQMFNDQRMSNSVAPEQVNSPKYVFQNEETTSDQRMLHSGEIPASNSVLQNQRAFNELFDSNGVIQDKKPALEQQPNYPLYGQRTINVNGFPGPKEEKPSNIVFQEKQSIESERTSPSERKPSSDQRLASEAGAFPKNEYPSTSGFTESASSDSEAELLIDCPHSSKLHYSSPPKTPEKKEGTLLQFQTPDGCNQNTSISKVLTRSTENLVDSKTRVEDAILVDKMLNEIRRSKSPISDIAPSENPLNSETENDEEVFKSQSNYKWKRKAPPTAAIAVKRSARLKAKESASTLSFSNIPGVQLGKYTKKRTERKRELKKPNEAEEVKEEKVEKKVEIISEIQLGFFKDLMEEEKLVIDDVPEPISPLKEVLFKKTAEDFDTFQRQSQAIQKGTPSEGISSTQVEPKSESIFKLPLEEVGSYRPTSWEETSSIQSDNTTPFEDQKSNEFCQRIPWRNRIETNLSDDKPNVIQEDHSSELISCKEKPASPPPIEQRPNETHITREIVESLPETTKPTHNSMISHLIANYNPTHQKILAQACQMDKDLLAQLQSIINGFTNGLGLVMDCIRMVDTLLDLTTSETHIAQAFIVIVKAAPRPETENAPIRELCLSQTLRKLISLFQPLHSRLPGLRRHLQSAIEQSLFTFTNDTMPLEVAMNLTQFYLAVIADTTATNNPARLFICKCLYFYNQKAIPMIYETLCVYPSVLPKRDDSTYDRSDALINTIQCLLMSTYYDMEKTDLKTREIFTKLRKFYNYESFKPPRDEVIENLIAKIQAGRFKNVSYAFVLICKRMDQKTTEKLVLAERLLPLANEYYHTLTQTTEYDERIACVLECISFIIKPFHLGTDISMYINLFGRFLNASNRQTIQEAALTALLRTVRFGYVHCFNAIYDFKPNYELANETKAMLKSFIYKKGLEFLRKLEHQARMLVTT